MEDRFPEELPCKYCNYLRLLMNERELKFERELEKAYQKFMALVDERDALKTELMLK